MDFRRSNMATITIKDLSENVDLDRKAMRDISGGARYRTSAGTPGAPISRGTRIVDFGTGVARTAGAGARPASSQRK
jgi:hypothetical protein